MKKYHEYSASDFLDDKGFIRYIKYQLEEDVAQWSEWLETLPPNEAAFREASISLTAMLSAVRIGPEISSERQVWNSIVCRVQEVETRRRSIHLVRLLVSAAAACLCLGVIAFWYYNSQVTVLTGNAQQETVILPDNSSITLNANSSLTYYRAWKWRKRREVWLKGEALFKVAHLNKDSAHILPEERFTAHAGSWSVQVLGTQFNIKQRRNGIAISLFTGSISVDNQSGTDKTHLLRPGEVLNCQDTLTRIMRIAQLTNEPKAWVDYKMQANGMSVKEITDAYEDMYGYRIVVGNSAWGNKRIDGIISLKKEDDVLYTLANILNCDIERQGNIIYLRPK